MGRRDKTNHVLAGFELVGTLSLNRGTSYELRLFLKLRKKQDAFVYFLRVTSKLLKVPKLD